MKILTSEDRLFHMMMMILCVYFSKVKRTDLPVNLDEYSTLYSPSGCSTIFAGTSSPVGAENNTKQDMPFNFTHSSFPGPGSVHLQAETFVKKHLCKQTVKTIVR